MISGLDLNATVDYTLKNDKENPTVWKIGVIPSYLFARLSATKTDEEIEKAYKILQVALKGWDNFSVPYRTEEEIMFGQKRQVVPMSVLEQLPLTVISELVMKVTEVNQLTDGERKN